MIYGTDKADTADKGAATHGYSRQHRRMRGRRRGIVTDDDFERKPAQAHLRLIEGYAFTIDEDFGKPRDLPV
ncbi:hypothetical protein NKJ74_23200 [Mesorhizobium sp. M0046]|uniref:hypothetical protein n=1 Tax=Mesorhizobium sp. M0046 TaxID=2956858 RepID=UPI003336FF86